MGVDFEQGDGYVKVSPKEYMCKVLERFGMSDCKPRYTPSEPKVDCSGEESANPNREAVGCLIYRRLSLQLSYLAFGQFYRRHEKRCQISPK